MEAAPQMQAQMPAAAPKQKLVAFLLAFFLGALGIHNFYLGKTKMGVVQLVLTITVVGALISGPWAFIQSILIILGKIDDADGNPLV
ncbi:MAG: TM2 domain-containing protein [Poseidonia sp.]